MKLQNQPNEWSCLPTAFAMAIDVPVAELIEKIGHDGSEIIRPTLVGSRQRRAFHIGEIIYAIRSLGFTAEPVFRICAVYIEQVELHTLPEEWFLDQMDCVGVLMGTMKQSQQRHAVGWDGHWIYDPSQMCKYHHSLMEVESLWQIHKRL